MQIVNNFYHHVQDYCNDIPADTQPVMVIASLSSFVIDMIVTRDLKKSAVSSVLTALATAIYGACSPLFKKVLGRNQLSFQEEMLRVTLATIGPACIGAAINKVNLIENLYKKIFSNIILSFCDKVWDVKHTNSVYIF